MRGKGLAVWVAIIGTMFVSILVTGCSGPVDSVLYPSLEFEEGVNPNNVHVGSQFRINARTNSRWEIQSPTWYLSPEAEWESSPNERGGKIIALKEGEATVSVNGKNNGNTRIHLWRTFKISHSR